MHKGERFTREEAERCFNNAKVLFSNYVRATRKADSSIEKRGSCGGYHHGRGVKTDAPANVVKEIITKLAT